MRPNGMPAQGARATVQREKNKRPNKMHKAKREGNEPERRKTPTGPTACKGKTRRPAARREKDPKKPMETMGRSIKDCWGAIWRALEPRSDKGKLIAFPGNKIWMESKRRLKGVQAAAGGAGPASGGILKPGATPPGVGSSGLLGSSFVATACGDGSQSTGGGAQQGLGGAVPEGPAEDPVTAAAKEAAAANIFAR